MKTKEELNALKEEVETMNKKLEELTEEELKQVIGGVGVTNEELTQVTGSFYTGQWKEAPGGDRVRRIKEKYNLW